MNRKSRVRTSGLFLLELTLAILFFAIVSAVCVQLFAKSHILTNRSRELTFAVDECASLAEICTTSDSISDAQTLIQSTWPAAGEIRGDSLQFFYDKNFVSCEESQASYVLKGTFTGDDSMMTIHMEFQSFDNHDLIYELDASHHIARRNAYAAKN